MQEQNPSLHIQDPLMHKHKSLNLYNYSFIRQQDGTGSKRNVVEQVPIHPARNLVVGIEQYKSSAKKRALDKLNQIYKYPASWEDAKCHQQANKVGKTAFDCLFEDPSRDEDFKQNIKVCPCCDKLKVIQQFPLNYSTRITKPNEDQQKNILPISVVMYFTFIKMAIGFLILRLFFDLYIFIESSSGKFCSNISKSYSYHQPCATQISAYNFKSASNQVQLNWLDFISFLYVIVAIAYMIVFRMVMFNIQSNYIWFPKLNIESYSVQLENLPSMFYDQTTKEEQVNYEYELQLKHILNKKVQQWLQNLSQEKGSSESRLDKSCRATILEGHQIDEQSRKATAKVSICYNLADKEKIQKLQSQTIELFKKQDHSMISEQEKQLIRYPPNKIKKLNKEMIDLCQHLAISGKQADNFKLTHFTGKAFVTFEYEHYRDYFIKKYEEDNNFLKISDQPVQIRSAHSPSDVNWENMVVSDSERCIKHVCSAGLLVILLLVSFVILYELQHWTTLLNKNKKASWIAQVILLLPGIVIGVINFAISKLLEKLSYFEKHKTQTERLRSLIVKIVIAHVLNICFIFFLVYIIGYSNPLGRSGIVMTLIKIICINGGLKIVFTLLGIPYVYLDKKMKTLYYQSNAHINKFQKQLNKEMEFSQFSFVQGYAFYIVYAIMASFYSFIAPLLTPILLVFFIIQYWIDKCKIFKMSSCSVRYSFEFVQLLIKMFEFSIVLFAVAHLIWNSYIHLDSIGWLNVITCLLAIFYWILSAFSPSYKYKINKWLRIERKPCAFSFSDYDNFMIRKFTKTYETNNPVTSIFADKYLATIYNHSENEIENPSEHGSQQNYSTRTIQSLKYKTDLDKRKQNLKKRWIDNEKAISKKYSLHSPTSSQQSQVEEKSIGTDESKVIIGQQFVLEYIKVNELVLPE